MRRVIPLALLAGLLILALLILPNEPLQAQATGEPEEEAPETFVPSEKLPAGSSVSFPIDI